MRCSNNVLQEGFRSSFQIVSVHPAKRVACLVLPSLKVERIQFFPNFPILFIPVKNSDTRNLTFTNAPSLSLFSYSVSFKCSQSSQNVYVLRITSDDNVRRRTNYVNVRPYSPHSQQRLLRSTLDFYKDQEHAVFLMTGPCYVMNNPHQAVLLLDLLLDKIV